MRFHAKLAVGLGLPLVILTAGTAFSQQYETAPAAPTARVETAPIDSSPPDRFLVPSVLEPARRVTIMAMDDGVVKSLAVPLGATVREGQEIVQLDKAEAEASRNIAEAEVQEASEKVKGASPTGKGVAEAHLKGAQARHELAKLAVERCTLKAPFSGRVIAFPISAGQYVAKGTVIAELADVSSLRMLVPVDRTAVKAGGTLDVLCEGKTLSGKIQAILPIPDRFSPLRDLALPWAAAWVTVANDDKALEPGLRVQSPYVPTSPIAVIPTRALAVGLNGAPSVVRIVRGERVYTISVHKIGSIAADRTQVSGDFRQGDVAIVESSVTLADGAFLRFGGEGDGQAIAEAGRAPTPLPSPAGVAPIGAPGSAAPNRAAAKSANRKPAPRPAAVPATKPAAPPRGAVVPF
jgi:multidrug efflux pump subunit AcrA (membrane-fusion protein)